MIETGLIVAVPEADPIIQPVRRRLLEGAALSVPAHVTVLYPFAPVERDVLRKLAALCAEIEPFEFQLVDVRRFEDGVLYLRPEPEAPFRWLTKATMREFPGLLPYEGMYGDPTPHLTVIEGVDISTMDAVAAELAPMLPIRTRATALTVMEGSSDSGWRQHARLGLGDPGSD